MLFFFFFAVHAEANNQVVDQVLCYFQRDCLLVNFDLIILFYHKPEHEEILKVGLPSMAILCPLTVVH